VLYLALDVRKYLSGIRLVPAPVQILGRYPKLDYEIAREVLWLKFAPLFPPEAEEGGFIIAHDDPGVGAANEIPAFFPQLRGHDFSKSNDIKR